MRLYDCTGKISFAVPILPSMLMSISKATRIRNPLTRAYRALTVQQGFLENTLTPRQPGYRTTSNVSWSYMASIRPQKSYAACTRFTLFPVNLRPQQGYHHCGRFVA